MNRAEEALAALWTTAADPKAIWAIRFSPAEGWCYTVHECRRDRDGSLWIEAEVVGTYCRTTQMLAEWANGAWSEVVYVGKLEFPPTPKEGA